MLTRRHFLVATALALLARTASGRPPQDGRSSVGSRPPARFFFTSQGKTAMMNADGTGLRWFDFDVPNQATWQPFGFMSDGHRALFLSMEPRRDGPGKPFEEYYRQTPTHIWVHDLDKGTLTEVANRDRLSPFYGGGLLLNDNRFIMQVVRQKGTQLYSMNLDGSDAKEFTRPGDGFPYGMSASSDGKRVAFHLATSSGYQVWMSDADGSNRVRVAADPEHLYFGPQWSSDGKWLIFHDCHYHQDHGHDWSDIFLCRPDGSEHRLLTRNQALWFGATYGSADRHGSGSETLYWTRDGKVLCACRLPRSQVPWEFQTQRPDTDHFNRDYKPQLARGGTEICKIDPHDGSVTKLTQPGEGIWDFRATESPDGKQIVFCRAKTGGSPAIWIMNADGAHQQELTKGFEDRGAEYPRWVPHLHDANP